MMMENVLEPINSHMNARDNHTCRDIYNYNTNSYTICTPPFLIYFISTYKTPPPWQFHHATIPLNLHPLYINQCCLLNYDMSHSNSQGLVSRLPSYLMSAFRERAKISI